MLNRMVNIKMVQSTTEMAKCGELTRWRVNIRYHLLKMVIMQHKMVHRCLTLARTAG